MKNLHIALAEVNEFRNLVKRTDPEWMTIKLDLIGKCIEEAMYSTLKPKKKKEG